MAITDYLVCPCQRTITMQIIQIFITTDKYFRKSLFCIVFFANNSIYKLFITIDKICKNSKLKKGSKNLTIFKISVNKARYKKSKGLKK